MNEPTKFRPRIEVATQVRTLFEAGEVLMLYSVYFDMPFLGGYALFGISPFLAGALIGSCSNWLVPLSV